MWLTLDSSHTLPVIQIWPNNIFLLLQVNLKLDCLCHRFHMGKTHTELHPSATLMQASTNTILLLILGRVVFVDNCIQLLHLGVCHSTVLFPARALGVLWFQWAQPYIPGFLREHVEGRLGAQGKPSASTSARLLVLLCSAVTVCAKKWLFQHHRVAVLGLGSLHSGQRVLLCSLTFRNRKGYSALLMSLTRDSLPAMLSSREVYFHLTQLQTEQHGS